MTPSDCSALASAYGKAWENDELAKLEKRQLKPKQAEAARAQVEKSAQEARDDWQSECDKTVGSPYLRSRLACAMKAKTVTRFNDCLDGKT
jgi:hypothetical protein